jgi:hypothetical protein
MLDRHSLKSFISSDVAIDPNEMGAWRDSFVVFLYAHLPSRRCYRRN